MSFIEFQALFLSLLIFYLCLIIFYFIRVLCVSTIVNKHFALLNVEFDVRIKLVSVM